MSYPMPSYSAIAKSLRAGRTSPGHQGALPSAERQPALRGGPRWWLIWLRRRRHGRGMSDRLSGKNTISTVIISPIRTGYFLPRWLCGILIKSFANWWGCRHMRRSVAKYRQAHRLTYA